MSGTEQVVAVLTVILVAACVVLLAAAMAEAVRVSLGAPDTDSDEFERDPPRASVEFDPRPRR